MGCPCLYVVAVNWYVSPGHLTEYWLEKVKTAATEKAKAKAETKETATQ